MKYIKDKFFFSHRERAGYFTDDKNLIKKLKNNEFISYEFAKSKYKLDGNQEKEVITNYKNNLEKLKNQLNLFNIKPIFITQVHYDINGSKILHFLNETLKEFSKENNYDIIKLDELINSPLNNSFVDTAHTNKKGSKEISEILYPELKRILIQYYSN